MKNIKEVTCPDCHGSGADGFDMLDQTPCFTCHGEGTIEVPIKNQDEYQQHLSDMGEYEHIKAASDYKINYQINTIQPLNDTHSTISLESTKVVAIQDPENTLETVTCKVAVYLELPLVDANEQPLSVNKMQATLFGSHLAKELATWGSGRYDSRVIPSVRFATTSQFKSVWDNAFNASPPPDGLRITKVMYSIDAKLALHGQYEPRTPVSMTTWADTAECHEPDDLPALVFAWVSLVDSQVRSGIAEHTRNGDTVEVVDYATVWHSTNELAKAEARHGLIATVSGHGFTYSDGFLAVASTLDGQRIIIPEDIKSDLPPVDENNSGAKQFKIAFTLPDEDTPKGYIGVARRILEVVED